MKEHPLISVVDDDESIRESLPDLLREFGYRVEVFSSAEDYLASKAIDMTTWLLLDIAMPKMTGLELMHELVHRGKSIPAVFITANHDAPQSSKLLECRPILLKPFSDDELRIALDAALAAGSSRNDASNPAET